MQSKELVFVDKYVYVIHSRLDGMPKSTIPTDIKVLALRKKEGRTAYSTNTPKSGQEFAYGPFSTSAEAIAFIRDKGWKLKIS